LPPAKRDVLAFIAFTWSSMKLPRGKRGGFLFHSESVANLKPGPPFLAGFLKQPFSDFCLFASKGIRLFGD
jgi:hypothetical protein